MKDNILNIEIDTNILEQNLVKMSTDRIEDNVIDTLVSKLNKSLSDSLESKLNDMLIEKMNNISINDIYNIKLDKGGKKINLFEQLISNMIKGATEKGIEFNEAVDKLVESIEYKSVNEEYKPKDFKVLTTYVNGEYGNMSEIRISINGKDEFSIGEGEPEDMTIGRDLSDACYVPDLIKKAYLAGKNGKIMYEAEETINSCDE